MRSHHCGNRFSDRSAINRANGINFALRIVALVAVSKTYDQFGVPVYGNIRVMADKN